MGKIVISDIDDDLVEALRRRAARPGRSTEEEVREILICAAKEGPKPEGLGTLFARTFTGKGFDFPIPELRDQNLRRSRRR